MEIAEDKEHQSSRIYSIIVAIVVLFCGFLLFKSVFVLKESPEEVVTGYVNALAKGNCEGAYKRVSDMTKEYYTNYRTFEDFKKNVCTPVKSRYEKIYVYKVDDVVKGPGKIEIKIRVRYKTAWMPHSADRPMVFFVTYSQKRWRIENESLEI